ncbi:hypothetical protein BCR34DRAFT_566914 [Clohesyomyces aquaticus]|uniref:Uncharacterized protein n=1 Tax=Clohesyomyces aquaticus TaxID=1231657 RepID=A0A1Y1ZJK3_9PLEO|nr:hypothetical protein BCR34DRAFT_566914 [Clohesyomyces aquaticus]
MLFNLQSLALALSISAISNALPLDGARKPLAPQSKTYAIVNVDGGSTAAEPATVIEETVKTKTVRATDTAPTVTDKITTVIIETPPPSTTSQPPSATFSWGEPFHLTPGPSTNAASTSTPTPSAISTISFSLVSTPKSTPQAPPTSSEKPSQSAEPSIATVVVTATEAGPTEYYDNGLWHTRYPVKTFSESVAVIAATSSTSTQTTTFATTTFSASSLPFNHT